MSRQCMERREAVARLLSNRDKLLVITGLGSPSYDVMAAGDHELNYYLWGAMGSAAMVGLGLANAQPDKPVLVITGDSELMMGMGALATIAVSGPKNLTIAVVDNGRFGETGMQTSHSGYGVCIDRVAASVGFSWTGEIRTLDEVDALRERLPLFQGPQLATLKVEAENPPRVLPSRDGVHIKNRFRAALGFQPI